MKEIATQKLKNLLDFIPLLIITASAVILIANYLSSDYILSWKNIVALAVIPVNYAVFAWKHKLGVLWLGLTLFIGLVGFLSYNLIIMIGSVTINYTEDIKLPLFHGQPIFLLWLIIHFIVSGRHYVAILTKNYWNQLIKS